MGKLAEGLAQRCELMVYAKSIDAADGTECAIVRRGGEKLLAVSGRRAADFIGEAQGGVKLCALSARNACALRALFPYTEPVSHRGRPFSMGLGDRLGLATPGHIRALQGCSVFPVFAQQSTRELALTNRTFDDVIGAAAFGVFQEGYRTGYGADGDHLKNAEEIRMALDSGCSMITLDCSEHIDTAAARFDAAAVDGAYAQIPEEVRSRYEAAYLGKTFRAIGEIPYPALKRTVLVFWRAVRHAIDCHRFIAQHTGRDIDFEVSIDEAPSVTAPEEHFVIAGELIAAGVLPVSMAPHFSGRFEKGIDYIGTLSDFERDLEAHQGIAEAFGYKLSVHSGSDKFSVYPAIGRITGGRLHLKTAGTNWLEAVRILAQADPALYRRAHAFALENREQALQYYHISADPKDIPDIALQGDDYLPEYLNLPALRQYMHIAYGMLLVQPWFGGPFRRLINEHEEQYYEALVRHIGKHLTLMLGRS